MVDWQYLFLNAVCGVCVGGGGAMIPQLTGHIHTDVKVVRSKQLKNSTNAYPTTKGLVPSGVGRTIHGTARRAGTGSAACVKSGM